MNPGFCFGFWKSFFFVCGGTTTHARVSGGLALEAKYLKRPAENEIRESWANVT